MGNCQAIDAATLMIQHPSGKTEKLYSSVTATHVMKMYPGHCVALLISTTMYQNKQFQFNCPKNNNNINGDTKSNTIRLIRIKLLKPNDTLRLGHVYRLITTQEVMKGIREKKEAKMKQNKSESGHKSDLVKENLGLQIEKPSKSFQTQMDNQATKPKIHRVRTSSSSTNNGGSATAKTRLWQPSLQSISEVAS